MKVYLLTTGSGEDGSEWSLVSIHSTRELAETAREAYITLRGDCTVNDIEEWPVDQDYKAWRASF